MKFAFFVFTFAFSVLVPVNSYKILGLFPVPYKSHYVIPREILYGLAEKGHWVTVYSPYPQTKPVQNFHDFDISKCSFVDNPFQMGIDEVEKYLGNRFLEVYIMAVMSHVSSQSIIECEPLRRLLYSNETFDLLITETFTYDVMLLFANKFKVPFISFSPNNLLPWHIERLSNPSNPSYAPSLLSGYISPMDFWQRFYNFMIHIIGYSLHYLVSLRTNDETNKVLLGPEIRSLYDIVKETPIFFTNTHCSLNPAAPNIPATVGISGAQIKPAKKIPQVCSQHYFISFTKILDTPCSI